jgi:L-2-hydroxyglutarate oxidase LhgO
VERADAVVIGAGVVGLAIARRLALAGRDVIVTESQALIGSGTSSRNSEVIHAGIYYRMGSRKASHCVSGKEMLYRFCAERGVPHRRCGKLIVAGDEDQVSQLYELKERAHANGVHDLELLSATEIAQLEPEIRGAADLVVKSAGLDAQAESRSIDGLPTDQIPPRRLAKGSYYVLNRPSPFQRLIYPVPEPGGLGIHATLDLGGRTRFGPDVEWIEAPDYAVNEAGSKPFYSAVRRYWPNLENGTLARGYAGIRPKIVGPGEPDGDFVLHGPKQRLGAGLIALYGIESPGLTASLAIAEEIVHLTRHVH